MTSTARLFVAALALAAVPSAAQAASAVVPPLVARGVDPLVLLNLTSLVASELDFMMEFDEVNQLDKLPSGLNSSCLGSASCLGNIAKANGAQGILAGSVAASGSGYDITLVYFKDGAIVRKKDSKLPKEPSAIANAMGPLVKETVTGVSQKQEMADASIPTADAFEDDSSFEDDNEAFSFDGDDSYDRRVQTSSGSSRELSDFGEDDDYEREQAERQRQEQEERQRQEQEAARRRAQEEEAARRKAEEEATRRRAEEERQRQEQEAARRKAEEEAARRRAEEERQRQEEEAARRRAEEERRRQEAAAASSRPATTRSSSSSSSSSSSGDDDFDLDDISFGSVSEDEIDVESISFGSAASSIVVDNDDGRSSSASRTSTSRYSDEDDDRSSSSSSGSSRYSDLDEDDDRGSSRSRSSSSRYSDMDDEPATVREPREGGGSTSLTGRVGYSSYQDLGFFTYGGELGFMPTDSLVIIGGLEGYSVKRSLPPKIAEEVGAETQWNTILPINAGALYKGTAKSLQPFFGGDVVIIPGLVRQAEGGTSGAALGLRARAGADYLVTDSFGFDINASVGFWAGKGFESVAMDMATSALVPSVSIGTVLLF